MTTSQTAQEQQQVLSRALIIGLGNTGLACARFLARRGFSVAVMDNRDEPPQLASLRESVANAAVFLGKYDEDIIAKAGVVILSPGVSPQLEVFSKAKEKGVPFIGDIELFARYVDAPVVAITGSNGKSTVTTLVGELIAAAGYQVAVGGNLGTPALDLLDGGKKDFYVLELSSFQLETTTSLDCAAAVVLNVSPDHIDRHGTVEHYAEIKSRIYRGHGNVIVNSDEVTSFGDVDVSQRNLFHFGLSEADGDQASCVKNMDGESWLFVGGAAVLPVSKIKLQGRHNLSNVLAALTLIHSLGISLDKVVSALTEFSGLPHRMQYVAACDGVVWINDSKGTNVGATIAALQGLDAPVVLIAGGQGKGADFSLLANAMQGRCKAAVLLGQDAHLIEAAIAGHIPVVRVTSMVDAVEEASNLAVAGDVVLLSPACASLDMFKGYDDRGNKFAAAVNALCAKEVSA